MVLNVIVDCAAFLVLSFAVVFGFGLALHILHRHADGDDETVSHDADEKNGDYTGDYRSLQGSLLTLFYALFGSFDADVSLTCQATFLCVFVFGSSQMCTVSSLRCLLSSSPST